MFLKSWVHNVKKKKTGNTSWEQLNDLYPPCLFCQIGLIRKTMSADVKSAVIYLIGCGRVPGRVLSWALL